MDQNETNKIEPKDRIINFYNLNKIKIYAFILILFLILILSTIFKYFDNKNNIYLAEKYVEAGIKLSLKKNDDAKKIYEEIILSKNNFYSILALNSIIENDLISNKNKILEYFNLLEKNVPSKDQEDLLSFKKALFLIKEMDVKEGNKLLKRLIEDNSNLQNIAKELIAN